MAELKNRKSKRKLFLENILFFNPIVYGSTYVLTQEVTAVMPSFFYIGLRFLIAFVCLIPLFGRLRKVKKEMLKISLISGVLFFIANASQTLGLQFTSPSKAGFITGLNVVIIPILLAFIFKIKPKKTVWIAVFLAILGIFVLSFSGVEPLNIGDLLVLICAISFSFYVIFLDKKKDSIDIIPFTIVQLFIIAFLSIFTSLLTENWVAIFSDNFEIMFSLSNILTLIYIGAVATTLTFLVQIVGQKYTPPSKTALILSLEPVFATIFGILLGNDILTLQNIIGFLLIFSGILVVKLGKKTS